MTRDYLRDRVRRAHAILEVSLARLWSVGTLSPAMDRRTIETAINSLDALLTADSPAESDYQAWFEANPIVMLALGFRRAVPHPVIPRGGAKAYIPDFLVQTANEAWEILELKTP